MGCIYHLGVSPRTSIDHNVCHDVESYTYGGFGIYLDQASSFVNVSSNLVYRTQCAGFFQHYGRGNTVVNNVFADVGRGDCSIGGGAIGNNIHNSPGDEGDEGSLDFRTNVVYLAGRDGQLFGAATVNGWISPQNESLRGNLYFSRNFNLSQTAFPCPPLGPGSYIASGIPLRGPRVLVSRGKTACVEFKDDGNLCVHRGPAPLPGTHLWCSDKTGASTTAYYEANMQRDGNLCVSEMHQHPPKPNTPIWCDQQGPFEIAPSYFANIEDSCNFCVSRGEYPKADKTLWCTNTTCGKIKRTSENKNVNESKREIQSEHTSHTQIGSNGDRDRAGGSEIQSQAGHNRLARELGNYPCTCSFGSWQKRGFDAGSLVDVDPLFVDASVETGNWELQSASPALTKLGFQPLRIGTAGLSLHEGGV